MPIIHKISHHRIFQRNCTDRVGRDGVAGGYVDTERGDYRIKSGVQHNAVATINVIFTDGRNGSDLKGHTVIEGDAADSLQRTADGFRCEGQVFQRSIHIHGCSVIQTNNGRHQHTAL